MDMPLASQRVLVMGGSSGIGLATASLFAAQGAEVIITGRDPDKLDRAARQITGDIAHRRFDAASTAQFTAFFAEDTAYDHLVLALSGGAGAGPLATLDLELLRSGFEAKFWLHTRILQAALPRLRAHGSVTFITAASARAALPGTAGLAAINGALEAMVRPLAVELAPLRINAVSPGIIDTPWWNGIPADQREVMFREQAAVLPVGRIGRPEDVAKAVLLTATNGFMTGTTVECAGGLHLASGR